MMNKFIYSAAVALAIAAIAPLASAQDRDKPEAGKSQKPNTREARPDAPPKSGRDKAPTERGMRKDGEAKSDTARRPDPKREQDKGSRPRDPRNEAARDGDNSRSKETRTFLGVATSPVHPALREHLDLDDGFGIQVEQVLGGSPAAKAGVRESDIITQLDEQRLIGPEHLSLLVRSMDSGDKVTLTFIRKGKVQTADLELGEKAESDFGPIGSRPVPMNRWHESMERNQELWRGWMDQNRRPGGNDGNVGGNSRGVPSGRPPAVSVRPGFPVKIFGASGIMKIDNAEGELTITQKDGDHHIVIKNKSGEIVHEGDFSPRAGVEGLPEKAREQLKVMKLDNLEVLTPPTEKCEPEETSAPRLPKSEGQPL